MKQKKAQMPNAWATRGERVRTPMRLQRAVRSRLECEGQVPVPTGTTIPRYFDSLQKFKRFMRRRLAKDRGALRDALLGVGSIYLRQGGGWDQISAWQVVKDFGLEPDTLHPHSECEELDQEIRDTGVRLCSEPSEAQNTTGDPSGRSDGSSADAATEDLRS